MHYFNSLVLVALSLPLVAHSKSLYIDYSCTFKPGWNDYWQESLRLARRAGERLDSATDTDFEAVFKRIFRTDKGSTQGQYVRGILKEFVDLSPVTDLKTSDIRVFCDNDRRWGSERPTGGWYDGTNELIFPLKPSCYKPGVLGRAYNGKTFDATDPTSPRAGHNPNRIVVVICDEAFKSGDGLPLRIDHHVEALDLNNVPIGILSYLVSATIVHEFAHALSYEPSTGEMRIRDLPDPQTAYGWKNSIQKPTDMAVNNADNYCYLTLWAVLADMGYTLPRVNEPGLSAQDKQDREDAAVKGRLSRYLDITKRMLKSLKLVARAFSA
ncbi:uncharacterized protein EI97DRAFT_493722 [Westerdykella ornata]|uniref:Lysine-specific metallo-endopeptidase domain-containing protein n=1 Tax=Westerdykella ornata TaxID=318751 RepID=A0A6A6JMV2_WESOR|nr:uncharacterized protein EI97DRAFT_493722 [Westerdykella ornata]KAF2277258.1 hypothetical protein EI97DRAFT_493722 [Westerdykella ornata]